MALQLIKTVAPCYTYELDGGGSGGVIGSTVFNPELLTPPRIYQESIRSLQQFFYDPVKDVYVTFAPFSYAYWPAWRMYRLAWNGADGSINQTYTAHSGFSLYFTYWVSDICVGGYNKFYATGNGFLDVREVDWLTATWTGWNCYDWAGRDPIVFRHAIVNREDSIVAGICAWPTMYLYNYDTHALLGKVAILDHGLNMTYESEEHLWLIHATGQLAKINYQTRRHEMLSKIANPDPEDITYRCAFDTNRKRLAILRHKPDATDGACRLQLEFYNPVPQAQVVTAPIPVNSLAAGQKITFSAHVLGDAGEGIASQSVTAELEIPAAGRLTTARALSGLNGGFDLEYNGQIDNTTETITVSMEV